MKVTLILVLALTMLHSASSRKEMKVHKCNGQYHCEHNRASAKTSTSKRTSRSARTSTSSQKAPCISIDKNLLCDGTSHCPLGDDEMNCTCTALTNPTNGKVFHGGFNPGAVSNYTCDIGFKLSINTARTCQLDLSWDGSQPSCISIVCQTLGNPENGVLSIDELSIGGKAKYSCNSGFAIMGTDERVCLKCGVWTGVAPSCLEIPSLNAYGTEFTTAFGTNGNSNIAKELSIIMVSTEEVTVTIESPFLASDIIVTFTDIHKEIFTTGLVHAPTTGSENKGVHISSTGRIAVFSSSFKSFSADAHLVYPDEILFNNYVVSTFPSAILNNKEEFVIVGTVDLTQVTIDIPEQSQIIFHLNRLQSYQHQGVGLSGTHITATKNVVVISGHECANIPNDDTRHCDYLVDQMLPINILQKAFIVSYMFPRPTFTIQLISPVDATVIKIYNAEGIQLEVITLNQGESEIRDFSDKDIISIIATNGIIVSQYTHGGTVEPIRFGDPSSTTVPGIIQYDNNYIFGTIDDSLPTHFVSIIMHTAYDFNDLHLDGQSVGGYPKLPITVPEWGTYNVMYVPIVSGRHTLTHTNANARYGTILYGYKVGAMYAFPVGMRL